MEKIKKIISKALENWLIRLVIIPFVLLSIWFVHTLLFNERASLSVLEYSHSNSSIEINRPGPLLLGDKIFGEFTAKENYLGVVSLKFNDFVRPDYRGEDVLIFRIKEKGANDWYYTNAYRSGSLKDQLLYPFGFAVISNSKNKIYRFEIESTFGNQVNAVEISSGRSILKSSYQYPRVEIIGSKIRLVNFLVKKTTNTIMNIDLLLASSLYLLPLIFYVLYLFYRKFNYSKRLYFNSVVALIVVDIFLLKEEYLGVMLGLLLTWIIALWKRRSNNRTSFVFSFFLIAAWLVLMFFNVDSFSHKLNIWVYSLLAIGTTHLIIEQKFGKKIEHA